MGPCTKPAQVFTPEAAELARAAFAEQIAALVAEGVDLVLLETFSDLSELRLAASVARQAGATVLASFTVDDEGKTVVGTPAETMAAALEAAPAVDAIGLNCGTGPAGAYERWARSCPARPSR